MSDDFEHLLGRLDSDDQETRRRALGELEATFRESHAPGSSDPLQTRRVSSPASGMRDDRLNEIEARHLGPLPPDLAERAVPLYLDAIDDIAALTSELWRLRAAVGRGPATELGTGTAGNPDVGCRRRGVLFSSAHRARVLASLAIHANPPLRIGEIKRAAGVSTWAAFKALRALKRLELIDVRYARGHKVYRVAERTPYRRAILAAALVDVGIRDALWPISPRLRFAMVIGSFAAGCPSPSSDIDLLIVGDITRTEVESLLAPIAERHDRALDPIVMTDAEYRSRFGGTDYLLRASARNGQLLLGDPDLIEV